MKIPTKTLKSGFALPVYGLGLWQMGGRAEADTTHDAREIEALVRAAESGVTHFDTAEQYAAGHSEELLGLALKGAERSAFTIATKVSPWNHHPDSMVRSLDTSLKRLQMDYVDLYLLHKFPDAGTPLEAAMAQLKSFVAEGRVKHIGVSNCSVARFRYLQNLSENPLVCNQLHYNVLVREAEHSGLLAQCQNEDALLVAWRPLQKGSLATAPVISSLANKYGKTPVQIMINWLVSQQNVVTIAKTSSHEHLLENLGAVDWLMESTDIERIRAEYPDQRPVSDAIPLNYAADVPA